MDKAPFFRLFLCVHNIADRPALHEDDGVVPVLTGGRSAQSVDIPGVDLLEYPLESYGGNMVAFVYDHHAVILDRAGLQIAAGKGL